MIIGLEETNRLELTLLLNQKQRVESLVLTWGGLLTNLMCLLDLCLNLSIYLPTSMTRYATIDEVNAAILQLEEREHASSADTMRPGISSNGKGTVIVGEAHKQQQQKNRC